MVDRDICNNEVLQRVLTTLADEIRPDEHDLSEASPTYKRSLAVGLLYKVCSKSCRFFTDLRHVRIRKTLLSRAAANNNHTHSQTKLIDNVLGVCWETFDRFGVLAGFGH